MHVEGGGGSGGSGAILHGLCTLGYAVRSVLSYCNEETRKGIEPTTESGWEMCYVECRFVNPVLVGEEIEVLVWDGNVGNTGWERRVEGKGRTGIRIIHFEVHRRSSFATVAVVKDGLVELERINLKEDKLAGLSKL